MSAVGLRKRLGALVYDWPRFVRTVRAGSWTAMRNRREEIVTKGNGVACNWEFTSDLHIAKVFPSAGRKLMKVALEEWPIVLNVPDEGPPQIDGDPEVTFVIGHRGLERLPHLLATLRSIAGTTSTAVECVVVEQSVEPEIRSRLPAWVRYVHTPSQAGAPYNRSWTLNAGARLARGAVVVLHDNDILVPHAYASEIVSRVAAGSRFIDLKRFTFYLTESDTARFFESGELLRTSSTVVQNLRGASIAAVRDDLFAIGGFDEEFIGWGGEDNDFWERAEAHGGVDPFGYLPFLHLFHAPQPGKLMGKEAPAVRRYQQLRSIPATERILRLRERQRDRLDR